MLLQVRVSAWLGCTKVPHLECSMQVFYLLKFAKMQEQNPNMASLLQINRICQAALDMITQVICLDINQGASNSMLAQVVKRIRSRPLLKLSAEQSCYDDLKIESFCKRLQTHMSSSGSVKFQMAGIYSLPGIL